MYCTKQKLSIVHYRLQKILNYFCQLCNHQYVLFEILKESVNITLGRHALLKKKFVGANHSLFMNKKLSKEIMKRSHLRN